MENPVTDNMSSTPSDLSPEEKILCTVQKWCRPYPVSYTHLTLPTKA